MFSHIYSVARPLKCPRVSDGSVSAHAVRERLFPLVALPGLHHRGALPVHILQGAHKYETLNSSYRNKSKNNELVLIHW